MSDSASPVADSSIAKDDPDAEALASALQDVIDDEPQPLAPVLPAPPPTPLNYAAPTDRSTTREDAAFNLARRFLFAAGVGLFCGGLGFAIIGYERESVPFLMGFGGALVAITFKPWRIDAWS